VKLFRLKQSWIFIAQGFCRETFPDFEILTKFISEKSIPSLCSEIEILNPLVVWMINK
jgi:hypothetical protein